MESDFGELQVLLVSCEESSEAILKSTAAALGRGYVLSQAGADSESRVVQPEFSG